RGLLSPGPFSLHLLPNRPPLPSLPSSHLLLSASHPRPPSFAFPLFLLIFVTQASKNPPALSAADDDDAEAGATDYDMDKENVEELDNKKDYDIEYDKILGVALVSSSADSPDDIEMVVVESFVSTQGWESETVVDYHINEEEFHKIRLFHYDFFIRKPPNLDDNVYDFREMYVTPPDTDVYSIPKVLAPMPQKYIRCAKSNFGSYNVTEPPIDAPRDPLYKTERKIMKIKEKLRYERKATRWW
ncbi:PLASTID TRANSCRIPTIONALLY ACTIVE protein 6, chloroplastic-like, partial [Zingiber officinale]|uniref:PLASTID TRANSCRIPTIONALLY ACTIVE protein 6, chloroplastic-like n=1 Tax=Zingiber officinale TaxID=94328 RepID=UPI001C4B383F